MKYRYDAVMVMLVFVGATVPMLIAAQFKDDLDAEREKVRVAESQVRALQAEAKFHRTVIASEDMVNKGLEAELSACKMREGTAFVLLGNANDQLDFLRERLRVRSAQLEAVLARLSTREADYVCALKALDGTPDPECWDPGWQDFIYDDISLSIKRIDY